MQKQVSLHNLEQEKKSDVDISNYNNTWCVAGQFFISYSWVHDVKTSLLLLLILTEN